jgi:hypothetical protein
VRTATPRNRSCACWIFSSVTKGVVSFQSSVVSFYRFA